MASLMSFNSEFLDACKNGDLVTAKHYIKKVDLVSNDHWFYHKAVEISLTYGRVDIIYWLYKIAKKITNESQI